MRLGAQLYTVREYTQTPEDIARTLKKVAEIGYRFVQCSALGPIAPEHLRALLDENGLTCVVTHDNPTRLMEDTEGVIREHQILGCEDIGLGMMPEKYRFSAEGVDAFARDIAPVIQRIEDAGMRFHYHNHDIEFQREQGEAFLDRLLRQVPGCPLLLCAFWAQVGGASPLDVIARYDGRIRCVHLKDMAYRGPAGVGGGRIMTPVMEGNMNYPTIVRALALHGVRDALVEQDICDGDPFECLRISYEHLRTLPDLAEDR